MKTLNEFLQTKHIVCPPKFKLYKFYSTLENQWKIFFGIENEKELNYIYKNVPLTNNFQPETKEKLLHVIKKYGKCCIRVRGVNNLSYVTIDYNRFEYINQTIDISDINYDYWQKREKLLN